MVMEALASAQERGVPLLWRADEENSAQNKQKTPAQKAVRKTFKLTAYLANLLPTGTVLTFQFLAPVLTHQGKCTTDLNRSLALALLMLCAVSCFLVCFTDSVRDDRGKVRHGIATFTGLWVIDGSVKLSREEAAKYRIRLVDLLHAVLSVLVFMVVALFDPNVIKCFCPAPSQDLRQMLLTVPVGIGVVSIILFLVFPTKRHGIGFPLSKN